MKQNRSLMATLAVCLVATPAVLAGSWFAGCTIKESILWMMDTGEFKGVLMCQIPNDYYQPGNLYEPSCHGIKSSAGVCDSSKWGWYCNPNEMKGWGWKRPVRGDCIQELNPDGTIKRFYVTCQNVRWDGNIMQVRAQCEGR